MKFLHGLAAVAISAAFFIAPTQAQAPGTVTNHSFAIGKGPGVQGFGSVPCSSAQVPIGQNSADPSCKTLSGDVTNDASGMTAIGAGKVTSSMIASGAVTSSKMASNAIPVFPSRAAASSLDLSAFSAIQTLGYASAGDGGGATFKKTTATLSDQYITGVSVSSAGSGCTNGLYNGSNVSTLTGTGRGALLAITVSGNAVTGISTTSFGNGYAVGDTFDQGTTFSCSVNPVFRVGSVSTPTGSFTDSAGNSWQLIVDQGNFLNIKQFGAKVDYYRPNGDPPGSTDDTTAVQNALYFAGDILPPTIDAYGQAGGILEVPRGISLVGALTVPQGVWFRGQGRYSSGLKMLNTLPLSSNWITVCDSSTTLACFGSQISDLTLWHNGTPSASAGTAMIFTNNLQQADAFVRLHIPSGSRSCIKIETGYGGAAYIGLQDVECGTNSATNPGIVINYPSAIVNMRGVISETGTPGLAQSGLSVLGGYLNVEGFHCENYVTCIDLDVPANSGMSRFVQVTAGGSGCVNAIKRESTSTANVNRATMISGICTNNLNNNGSLTTTPIVADVTF